MGERKNQRLTLEAVSARNKKLFGRTAHSYVIFLFKGVREISCFSLEIVEGLGSFNLDVKLVFP